MANKVIELGLPEDLSVEQAIGYVQRHGHELSHVIVLGQLTNGHYISVHGGEVTLEKHLWLIEVERATIMNKAFDVGSTMDPTG